MHADQSLAVQHPEVLSRIRYLARRDKSRAEILADLQASGWPITKQNLDVIIRRYGIIVRHIGRKIVR